ncbi:hypothetical protein AB0H18_39280 [Streptomyces sp. NPDC020766]
MDESENTVDVWRCACHTRIVPSRHSHQEANQAVRAEPGVRT